MAADLDDIDRAILAELTKDGRLSMRALADEVHISRANAYSRVERLQSSGVITGFTVLTDPQRLGLMTTAYVTLHLQQDEWQSISRRLLSMPEVAHWALTGGDFDAILLIRARDNSDLRRIVLGELQNIPGVLNTRTLLVFEDGSN